MRKASLVLPKIYLKITRPLGLLLNNKTTFWLIKWVNSKMNIRCFREESFWFKSRREVEWRATLLESWVWRNPLLNEKYLQKGMILQCLPISNWRSWRKSIHLTERNHQLTRISMASQQKKIKMLWLLKTTKSSTNTYTVIVSCLHSSRLRVFISKTILTRIQLRPWTTMPSSLRAFPVASYQSVAIKAKKLIIARMFRALDSKAKTHRIGRPSLCMIRAWMESSVVNNLASQARQMPRVTISTT